jgi:hypothetical protein
MPPYLLVKFAHVIGVILMGAGLIGVFVSDLRARQLRELPLFAEAYPWIPPGRAAAEAARVALIPGR